MSKAAAGAVFGAGAATAYYKPELLLDLVRSKQASGVAAAELAQLNVLIEKLAQDITASRSNPDPTVFVQKETSFFPSGKGTIVLSAAGAVGVYCTYMHLKGWSIQDMFYVTRRSFNEKMNAFQTALHNVWHEVREFQATIMENLGLLQEKQQELCLEQERHSDLLETIVEDLEDIKGTLYVNSNTLYNVQKTVDSFNPYMEASMKANFVFLKIALKCLNHMNFIEGPEKQEAAQFIYKLHAVVAALEANHASHRGQ